MNQQLLVNNFVPVVKSINLEGVKAEFTEVVDGVYDVVLEINSQKFLIKLANYCGNIQNFEVIASRGFVTDLTSSLIFALKSLVEQLQIILR